MSCESYKFSCHTKTFKNKKQCQFPKRDKKQRCMANCPEAMRPFPSPPCCAVCLCGCGRMMPFGRRMRQKHALHIWMVIISLYLMSLGLASPCFKGHGKFMCWLISEKGENSSLNWFLLRVWNHLSSPFVAFSCIFQALFAMKLQVFHAYKQQIQDGGSDCTHTPGA